MKVMVIGSSPNTDGLTAACAAAAVEGLWQAGAESEEVHLNELNVGMCRACDNGWGTCLKEHRCQEEDGFQALHAHMLEADAYVLVSPVYWGEMSESAKALTDRLRRCEATREQSGLSDKPVIAVAAAGGSGGGMITCLGNMERWIEHVGARTWDLIPVNRWSREYKLVAIREAARAMAQK